MRPLDGLTMYGLRETFPTTGSMGMIARNVANILSHHVTLSVEGIGRMYLNAYVPDLQHERGVFRGHRGQPLPSGALMRPMSRGFVKVLERFVAQHDIPILSFRRCEHKDDIMAERLRHFAHEEGVVFVGKAQEKTSVSRTERRKYPTHVAANFSSRFEEELRHCLGFCHPSGRPDRDRRERRQ